MKNIGTLVSSKGLIGEMRVRFYMELKWDLLDHVMVEKSTDSFIPYAVEYLKDSGKDDLKKYILFGNIQNKEAADALAKKELYLEDAVYDELLPENSWFRLLGYTLYDGEQEIAKIYDIIVLTQTMFVLDVDGDDVYVPYVESWIEEVDDEEKKIYMQLPEGLLEVNRDGEV